MEVVEALLVHGKIDLCTAFCVRQSCGCGYRLVSKNVLNHVIQNNDSHFWVWLTKKIRETDLISIDDISALREDMAHDKENVVKVVNEVFRSDTVLDVSQHTYIIKSCFSFDIHNKSDPELTVLGSKIVRTIGSMLDAINNIDDTIEKKAIRSIFLFKVIEPIVLATIHCNIRIPSFPLCKLRFLGAIINKLDYFITESPQHIPARDVRAHSMATLRNLKRVVCAWRFAMISNTHVYFGAKNGIYTMNVNGCKRYW